MFFELEPDLYINLSRVTSVRLSSAAEDVAAEDKGKTRVHICLADQEPREMNVTSDTADRLRKAIDGFGRPPIHYGYGR